MFGKKPFSFSQNILKFQEYRTIDSLVLLLNNQPEEVLVNVVGALAECAKEAENRGTIRKAGGISQLVSLLTGTNPALLVNTCHALRRCAEEPESISLVEMHKHNLIQNVNDTHSNIYLE